MAAARAVRPRRGVLVDSGVLVALYRHDDPRHGEAATWFAGQHAPMHTVEAVLTEAAYFMAARARAALARLAASGRMQLHRPDSQGHARMAELFAKYEDRDPDWADVALVWLAEATGITRIANGL